MSAGERPPVDVVLPFAGPSHELDALTARAAAIALRPGDTVTVVDNGPDASEAAEARGHVRVVGAPHRQSSYHARNRGVASGSGEWIVFLDADVEAPADLLERYFAQPPAQRTGVIAGAIVDEPLDAASDRSPAARYASLRARMAQENTLLVGEWGYAQTANCGVRRSAFEQLGGFRDHLRSGGDADLCFRLRRAGWGIEQRPGAAVVHRSRRTLRAMLRQRARHGAGAAWLEREYPGSFPRWHWRGLAKWTVQSFARAAFQAARGRRDDALTAALDPLDRWAFQLGRLFPNTTRRRR